MTGPAFDELLGRLVGSDVGFVLIGGLAVNAWGVVRGTKDVDVVVDPDPENVQRLARVAVSVGAHVQAPEAFVSSPFAIAALPAEGERVLMETELGPLDVVQRMAGVPSYAELRSRAADVQIGSVTVPVCALSDLRAMKRAAGRTRDLADLEELDLANDPGQD